MMLRSRDKQGQPLEPHPQSSDSDEQGDDEEWPGLGPYTVARSLLARYSESDRNCHLSADEKKGKLQLAAKFNTPVKTPNESQKNSSCEALKPQERDRTANQGEGMLESGEENLPSSREQIPSKGKLSSPLTEDPPEYSNPPFTGCEPAFSPKRQLTSNPAPVSNTGSSATEYTAYVPLYPQVTSTPQQGPVWCHSNGERISPNVGTPVYHGTVNATLQGTLQLDKVPPPGSNNLPQSYWDSVTEPQKTNPQLISFSDDVSVYPVREQVVYDNSGRSTGKMTHHVIWTPSEMKGFLSVIPHPRTDPIKFAKELLDIQTSYNANWSDMLQIMKRVCGDGDLDEILSKTNIPRTLYVDSSHQGDILTKQLAQLIKTVYPPQSWTKVSGVIQGPKEDCMTYYNHFKQAVESAGGDINNSALSPVLIHSFITRLRGNIREKLMTANPDWRDKPLSSLLSLATAIERNIADWESQKPQKICIVTDQLNNADLGQKPRGKPVCFKCHRPGHFKKDCRAARPNRPPRQERESGRDLQ